MDYFMFKDTLNQDVIPQKVIRPSPLQIKLGK